MKKAKMFFAVLMVAALVLSLASCNEKKNDTTGSSQDTSGGSPETSTTSSEPDTGTAGGVKPVILVISFGTSYNDNRELSIGAIEADIAAKFPNYEIRRAFTSQIIIDILKDRDKINIDNVKEAMDRLVADGVKEVIIQPTHVMNGFEYNDVVDEVRSYKDKFETLKFGKQLLASNADYEDVVKAMQSAMKAHDDGNTAFVLVGHGSEHPANIAYTRLQNEFKEADLKQYFIGTVEAEPSYDEVLEALKESGYKKVVLAPFMVVAGDHANNDICGEEDDAWMTMLKKEGFEVVPHVEGIGQIAEIRDIYVRHVESAISTPAIVGPVTGEHLNAGTYTGIEVASSSSMFKIIDCRLDVAEDGSMTAVLTLNGKGYGKL
ncbi:MAG: sirohydrochlorin cobaltochelatase, partial [Bacillota bacterium]|nr:sirohydrochlorin cobaltochelatase [Bacillota bacterium]